MSKRIDLDLSNIAEGGLQEKVDMEMAKVFENIHDLNTKATTKRKLTITLELEPDENREVVKVNSTVKSNLAPLTDVSTTILTGINDSGEVEANELRSGAKGQTFFDPDDGKFKDDKGTPVEEIENQGKVIDLQKRG
ncbi:replication terminator protein [Vagococcus elongatus]|uniref:Replication terminator protein n=1 Tax=Vagococcus elongatus TaxID=180344 RepID=A0A430AU53_9ENTE|nr:replication terminator protein [Vagococcus elongatus]RSU11589.1 replication terminator protein [Vagococcus elongatus]